MSAACGAAPPCSTRNGRSRFPATATCVPTYRRPGASWRAQGTSRAARERLDPTVHDGSNPGKGTLAVAGTASGWERTGSHGTRPSRVRYHTHISSFPPAALPTQNRVATGIARPASPLFFALAHPQLLTSSEEKRRGGALTHEAPTPP